MWVETGAWADEVGGGVRSRHLPLLPGSRTVEFAGLVVCRQQPLTARGIVFLLLEDEFGMVNVLVELTERNREAVRPAPSSGCVASSRCARASSAR
jgi:error-prone DNA polymerase